MASSALLVKPSAPAGLSSRPARPSLPCRATLRLVPGPISRRASVSVRASSSSPGEPYSSGRVPGSGSPDAPKPIIPDVGGSFAGPATTPVIITSTGGPSGPGGIGSSGGSGGGGPGGSGPGDNGPWWSQTSTWVWLGLLAGLGIPLVKGLQKRALEARDTEQAQGAMAKGADKASLRPALDTIRHKTVDPVVGAARSVKHAVGDAKDELAHKASEGKHRSEEAARKAGHRADEAVDRGRHRAEEAADKAKHRAEEKADRVSSWADKTSSRAQETVSDVANAAEEKRSGLISSVKGAVGKVRGKAGKAVDSATGRVGEVYDTSKDLINGDAVVKVERRTDWQKAAAYTGVGLVAGSGILALLALWDRKGRPKPSVPKIKGINEHGKKGAFLDTKDRAPLGSSPVGGSGPAPPTL